MALDLNPSCSPNCTESDVVQSNVATQDTLIFLAAVLVFLFGFYIGYKMIGDANDS